MAFIPTINVSGLPQRQVFPGSNIHRVDTLVAPQGTAYIGGNALGDWLHAAWPWLAWDIESSSNMTLVIETSQDDVFYRDWRIFCIYATIINRMVNLNVPGWKCRLRLESTSAGIIHVYSNIKWRASP